jgi:hypothetical protein
VDIFGAWRYFNIRQATHAAETALNGDTERRGTQVVRERSAKPLCVGSIPTRASKFEFSVYEKSFPQEKSVSELFHFRNKS